MPIRPQAREHGGLFLCQLGRSVDCRHRCCDLPRAPDLQLAGRGSAVSDQSRALQLFKDTFRPFKIATFEAFSEPAVDRRQHAVRFPGALSLSQKQGETCRRSQFPSQSPLFACKFE